MSKEWREVRLGEIADFINGDRGKNYPSPLDRVENGIPFINTGHIDSTGWLSHERMDYISREKYDKLGSGKVRKGDIVYCLRGSTIGKTARNRYNEGAIASSLIIIRAKENINQDFLYYFLISPFGQSLARINDNGSAQPNLSGKVLSQYPLKISDFHTQKAIAKILGDLDDKIELNRQMNQTLEEMAQTLFQSWFVDFDPVMDKALEAGHEIPEALQAKAEKRKAVLARPDRAQLPDEIMAYFPDQFEYNEALGKWIPMGWEDSTFGNEFNVTMGQSPPGSTYNEEEKGVPFFQGKTDFQFRFPKNRIYCTSPKRLAQKNDTLISVRAPVGSSNLAKSDCSIGRGLSAVRHKFDSISYTYYAVLELQKIFDVFEGEGTVFGSINH
ncbi:hypothetical protein FUAX_00340 [Fulvitalea axinellae]|uniref:Type I restriction modification DNA specificity domain-containing protein n=1 Tax=Fulvitalea axinellae TaxID=1182444 RepID=A0AAU9CID6_9BACT|nr:hypothetical protein FUAX_00340 [Fulvitalea axinellae]